ncbi:MAG: hypothetical protein K1X67_16485 [Fimbriimonadaceae bacterium]|nr:hypothetical protein [Fimbriimonadaceae bacterium]
MSGNKVGSDALALVESHLEKHPSLNVIRSPGRVTVQAPPGEGFDVELVIDGAVATIFAGGWHDHFVDPEEAAATFMWLLTTATRIVLRYRGKHQIGWRLEWFSGGTWVSNGFGRILVPVGFWLPVTEVILQNNLVPAPDSRG